MVFLVLIRTTSQYEPNVQKYCTPPRCVKYATLNFDKQENFGNIEMMMSKFGSKSGDFAQRVNNVKEIINTL